MSRFPIPAADAAAPFQTEIIIRRSRFLTHCAHTPGMEAARAFVEQIRTKHADATHNCWAFVAGAPGHSGQVGFSDDGEPHGTAGRPMLQVLLHCGVGEITMVVTRWFGGVKLGTGGLVRAYQDSVRENLATLPLAEKVPTVELDVQLDYAHLDRLHRLLPTFEARVCAEAYDQAARVRICLPEALRCEALQTLRSAEESPRLTACAALHRLAALCEEEACSRAEQYRAARLLWPRLGACLGVLTAILLW